MTEEERKKEEQEVLDQTAEYKARYGADVDMFLGGTFQRMVANGDSQYLGLLILHLCQAATEIQESVKRNNQLAGKKAH